MTKGSFFIYTDKVYVDIEYEDGIIDNDQFFDLFEFTKKDNEVINCEGVYFNG